MKTKYAFQIGGIKFLSRLASNILSGCSIMLAVVLILVSIIAVNGLTNMFKSILKDSFVGKNFAAVVGVSLDNDKNAEVIVKKNNFGTSDITVPQKDIKNRYESISVQKTYEKKVTDTFEYEYMTDYGYNRYVGNFSLIPINDDSQLEKVSDYNLTFTDPYLVQDDVYGNYTFDKEIDGKIPVLIPFNAVFNEKLSEIQTSPDLSQKERFEQSKDLYENLIGKTFKLIQTEEPVNDYSDELSQSTNEIFEEYNDLEFIIVGFSAQSIFSDYDTAQFNDPFGITIPDWTIGKYDELNEMVNKNYDENVYKSIYYEFNHKDDMDEFVESNFPSVQYVRGPLENLSRFTDILLKVVYAFGGFLLTIASFLIFITINKAVLDSEKEIGVFRSIGAKTWDIRKIYFAYSLILVNLSFAVGFVISLIIDMAISILWGDDIFYAFASFSNFDVSKPLFVFVSFPFSILVFFLIIQLVGLLAALIPSIRATRINPIEALREE